MFLFFKKQVPPENVLEVFLFGKTRNVVSFFFGKYLKLPQFDKYLKLPHFGKYLKLPYKVKCNQLFHFFEISTTCRHFGFSTNATSTKSLTVMGGKRLVHS